MNTLKKISIILEIAAVIMCTVCAFVSTNPHIGWACATMWAFACLIREINL